jgi:hypothetical protein
LVGISIHAAQDAPPPGMDPAATYLAMIEGKVRPDPSAFRPPAIEGQAEALTEKALP